MMMTIETTVAHWIIDNSNGNSAPVTSTSIRNVAQRFDCARRGKAVEPPPPAVRHLRARHLIWLSVIILITTCQGKTAAAPQIFILGDMEKPTGEEQVVSSPHFFKN